MSLPLISFLIKNYIRSYRYFPPMLFFLIAVMLLYSYKPNPILESYAISSIFLYIVSAWLGYSFINTVDVTQEHILRLKSGSTRIYLSGRTGAVFVCSIALILFALIYPIITNMFDETVKPEQMLLAIAVHSVMALLGILISLFCNHAFIRSGSVSIATILTFLTVTLAAEGIIHKLGRHYEFIFWLLPPAFMSPNLLLKFDTHSSWEVLVALTYPVIYFVVVYQVFVLVWQKRM